MRLGGKISFLHLWLCIIVMLVASSTSFAQVVILQQGFDSTSGSQSDGTWTNVDQIQNGGNDWTNSGSGNDVIEGNNSCSGWSTCNDKTGHTYGISGGAPVFKGTGTNVGYGSTNSSYFAIFDDYDASSGTYGTIYTPDFNLSGYTSCNLTFYWNNANTDNSYIQVQYYNGSSWTGATNFGEGTGSLGWHEATMSLPSTATEVVIFIVSDYYYYAIGLDQIEIYGTPSCTLTASIGSHTNVSPCSYSTNGAATVSASGGTTPYTYSWTPSSGLTGATTTSASAMSETAYTCTVTDHAGCTATPTVTIGGPAAIRDSMSSTTNVACNGGSTGSATVGVKGGTSPYTYSWSSSHGTNATASSLSAGTYSCTITDANSCTATATVTITQPSQLRDSIHSSTNVLCYGSSTGSATVGVKGGTTPYTYSWSPSGGTSATASNLAAGTYTVTVTDHNSCTNTATVTITQSGSAVSATITTNDPAPCHGEHGSATVTAAGGTTPYTYSWTSGATTSSASLLAGSYTVTVTDHNSCVTTATVSITQPATFQGTITTYNVCGSGDIGAISVQITGGTQPYTYSWNPNVSTTDSAGGLSVGDYTVNVNDANGCGPLEGTTTITAVTAETVTVSSSNISCYGGNNGSATATGNPTHSYIWEPGGSTSATISGLATGIYTVVATETDECTATATVNITQPSSALSATVSSSTPVSTCSYSANGAATVSVSGGTTPYAYSWTPSTGLTGATTASASGMSETAYTCSITDHNECTTTATVTIGGPAAIRDSISSSTNISCNGSSSGSATVGVKGGTTPYTYSWSSGYGTNATASNMSAGTYTCTITDAHSCTATATVTITQTSQLRDSIHTSTNVLCNGSSTGSATVGVKGGATPYTYSWSPGGGTSATASNLAAGTYTVTVTDHNSCTNTATVTITQPGSAVSATITTNDPAPCNGENGSVGVTATGGTTPYTYSWTSGGGTHSTASLPAGSYTVTVTDHNSCTTTATVTVTQPAVFEGTVTQYNICGSGSTGAISLQITGGTLPYTYTWTPNVSTTDSAGGLTARNYTVSVNDANGCGPLVTDPPITITTITAETVSITSSSNVSCYGGSNGSATALGSPTHSYVWEPGNGTSATISGLSSGIYTVVATETDGCTATTTVDITQPTIITPTTSFTNTCTGTNNGAVSVGVTGGVSPYTYSWSPGGNTTTSVSGLAAGTYTVTVTDHNSCVQTATATISANPLPTLTVSPSSASICTGSSASLSVSGANTYTWAPNTNLSATTGSSVSASPTSAITYTITGTNSNGCVSTQTVTVTVNPLPTVTVSPGSASACLGGSASLTAGGANTYTWAPNINLTATTGATVSASPTVTTTYTVTGTDVNGCVNTQSVMVTVNPLPTLTVTASPPALCGGGSSTLSVSGANNYTWNPSTGLNSTTGSSVFGRVGSTTIYTVTGTDVNGCVNTQSVTVTVNPVPTASISAVTNAGCGGSTSGSATVAGNGGSGSFTYSWNTSPVQTNAQATGLAAGNYTATVTDVNGCSATATVNITATSLPTPSVTTVPVCGSSTGDATVLVSGATAPYSYAWSTSPVQTNITATGLSPGNYSISVTDALGCIGTATFTITQSPSLPVVTVGTITEVSCNGSSNGSIPVTVSGGTSPYTFLWSNGETTQNAANLVAASYSLTVTDISGCSGTTPVETITEPNPLIIGIASVTNVGCSSSTSGGATISANGGTTPYVYAWSTSPVQTGVTASGLSMGSYTVTVTDANSCTATSTVNIQEAPSLTAKISVVSACQPSLGSATVTPSGGTAPYTYNWSPSGGTGSTASGLSSGTYSVTITDATSCTVTETATVNSYSVPTVTMSPSSASINLGQSVTFTPTGSGGTPPYVYTWSPPDGLSVNFDNTVVASPVSTVTYTVTVTDANNACSSNVTVPVTVSVPTTQTPTSCDTCIGGLNLIPGKVYLVSVWTKDSNAAPTDTTYLNPSLSMSFSTSSGSVTVGPFSPQGRIIDGWQRIEAQFTVPLTATTFNINLSSANVTCNFDDLRVFPFNGTLKTYVYDPITLRLMAVLDERNYATIYEYDEEGKLVRVKKETERGIMTIQESRTGMQKQ